MRGAVGTGQVLYPGSYVDIAPSFVWPSVTYVDSDPKASRFFADVAGVEEIIATQDPPRPKPEVTFLSRDYTVDLGLARGGYDLLISLYAGLVSEYCTQYLRVGGTLLVNSSHGDAAMASIDKRYSLRGVIVIRKGDYSVGVDRLESYLVPKKPVDLTPELIRSAGRGISYTKSPFAYLFERIR